MNNQNPIRRCARAFFASRPACALLFCTATALAQPAGVTVTDLGNFAGNASTVQTQNVTITTAAPVVWFKIRLPRIAAPFRFLDISTSGTDASFDTELALYRADGALIAADDDDGANNYSALSFGMTDLAVPGRVPPIAAAGQSAGLNFDGRDGTLTGDPLVSPLGTAGDYYIAVTQYNANFLNGFVINRLNGTAPGLTTLLTVRMNTPSGQVAPTVNGIDAERVVGDSVINVAAIASANTTGASVDLSSINGPSNQSLSLFGSQWRAFMVPLSSSSPLSVGVFPMTFRASNAIGDVTIDVANVTVLPRGSGCTVASESPITTTPGTTIYTYATTLGNVDGPWTGACYTSVPTGNDVWFRFVPTQNGTVTLSTCNSDTGAVGGQPDTLLGFRGRCDDGGFSTCGDDVGGCGLGTKLSNIPVIAGQEYNIAVRSFSGDIVDGKLAVTFTPTFAPPTQSTSPAGGGQAFDNRQQSIALSLVTRSAGFFGLGVPVRVFAYPRSTIVSGSLSGGGWLPLEGQLLSIASNEAMFTEIGTTFGGNGQTNFAIPDARERVIVGDGNAVDGVSYIIGDTFGTVQQTLLGSNLPSHAHSIIGPNSLNTGATGLSQSFDNAQPSLVLPMFVANQGTFPTSGGGGSNGSGPAEPFLGQVLLACRVPTLNGYTQAGGALIPIAQNSALFSLYGTSYGGNGQNNFQLPDLRGRTPMYAPEGVASNVGLVVGSRQRTLTTSNLPPHTHGTPSGPTGSTGVNQPFDNRQTSLGLQFGIATGGVFPSSGTVSDQDPYVGEIFLFGGTFPPNGLIPCDGRLLAIGPNAALFSLIGTTFGGNGQTTFAVPDLRNRAVVGASANWPVGEVRGSNTVSLTTAQMPAHTHTYAACTLSDVAGPGQAAGPDGTLTADDIIVFLNWFFAGNTSADVAGPGQSTTPDAAFTADDIIVFLNRFFAGC